MSVKMRNFAVQLMFNQEQGNMKYFVITVLTLLLGFYTSWAQPSNQLVSRNLSAKDGLSSNQVYDILQDKQGFLWFASSNGLTRYDGYAFLNYGMLNSQNMQQAQATLGHIYYDGQNELIWVRSSLSYLACYNLRLANFEDYTGRNDYMRRYSGMVRDGGNLWLYDAKEGIRFIQYANGQFVCTDYTRQGAPFAADIQQVLTDAGHHAWIASKMGLYYHDASGMQCKAKGNFRKGQRVGNLMAFMNDRGMLYLFDKQGRMIRKASLAAHPGLLDKPSASVGWNNQWILFMKGVTYSIDLRTMEVTRPADFQMTSSPRLLESIQGTDFVSTKNGDMIIFSPLGIYRHINLLGEEKGLDNRFRKYNVCAKGNNRFVISTYGNGAFVYDMKKGILEHYRADDGRGLLTSNFLTGVFVDRNGCLWLSQDEGGVVCISKSFNTFMNYIYPVSAAQLGSNANSVSRILFNAAGKVQLVCKNKTRYEILDANLNLGARQTIPYGIYSTLKDSKGHFWEGYRTGGLYVDGKLCREAGKEKGNVAGKEAGKKEEMTINDVYSMAEDKWGRIWMATIRSSTDGGVIMARYEPGKPLQVERFLIKGVLENSAHCLSMDEKGILWVATSDGLYFVDTRQKNITGEKFQRFNMANGKFPYNDLLTVRCASDGTVWAGGIGTGLLRCRYDEKKKKLSWEAYSTENGLGSNNVYSIMEDPSGNIWAGTESGLARVDVRTGRIDNNIINDDIQSNAYQENSAIKLSDGRLLFGTNNGMVVVNPYQASIARVQTAVKPTITDVWVDGVSIFKMPRFGKVPSRMESLEFRHDENSITISFSNFDYAESGSSVYQYYLEGVDKGWNSVTNKNSVSYNALLPGDYVFHLRSMGRGNKWSNERTLKIHISEPWYNMWYAWMAYLLVVTMVGYYVVRNRKEKFQLHQRMKMEKQVNDFRINFFTHVTHEFRTPLAIIQSAVSKIMDEKTGAVSRASVQTAVRGTKRLSRLVTQLMEFRKINSDGLRLQVLAGVDIVGFVRNIYQDFWYAAKQKDIVMNYQIFEKKHEMTCDRHIVETVVYNLLSNAVKYTPARGEVSVRMEADEAKDMLRIIVSDSGAGISEEQQKSLFQPFMHGYVSQGGMGIGLYVAKMMAEAHHGSLVYRKSEKLGGAEFIFCIPLSDDGYTSEEYLDTTALADNQTAEKDEQQLEDIKEMLPEALNNVTVAVIEDDPDMLDQIRSELAVFFKVVTYSNGKQGLEGVLAEKPALLVCDVMLPDMNGYDIVKQIKKQPDGYALPVIMLTALSDEKHQIKGYKAGADDYMVKPCNFNLLVARIVQLVIWSQNLPKVSEPSEAAEASSAISTKSLDAPKAKIVEGVVDKNMLKNFEMIVAQHLSDPNFTIDTLAEMMHMGRTKLYGKIKDLTGETPNKYIMRQRMNKAAELLLTGDYTVSDVCYKLGLEDVSYFNKCFKSYYGISPSRYGK